MSARKPALAKAQLDEYDRLMLRSALVSLFWAVIADRKKRRDYKLQDLADAIGMDKSGVSRWFSGNNPNWTLNTVADIANALNVDLRVEAVDRETGIVYTSQGRQIGSDDAHELIEAAEEQAALEALKSTGQKILRRSQQARARDGQHSRTRKLRKTRP